MACIELQYIAIFINIHLYNIYTYLCHVWCLCVFVYYLFICVSAANNWSSLNDSMILNWRQGLADSHFLSRNSQYFRLDTFTTTGRVSELNLGKNKNQNKLPLQSACLPSIVSVSFLKLSRFQICPALVALVPRLPDWSTLGHEASVGFLRDLPMPGACWHADHVTEFHPRSWIKELPLLVEI